MFTSNIEMFKEKYPNFKKVAIGIGVLLLFLISFGLGHNNASVTLGNEKVKYDVVQKKISAAKSDLKEYQSKLVQVKSEYDKNRSDLVYAKQIYDQKTALEGQIGTLNGQIDTKTKESQSLDATIQSKNAQIASLDQAIKVKQEAPIQLPAGQFLVGKDIKAGRYKVVVAAGRGSNFQVFDSSGQTLANTIIYKDTSDGFGVSEYVTILSDGDMINAEASFKYIPVE